MNVLNKWSKLDLQTMSVQNTCAQKSTVTFSGCGKLVFNEFCTRTFSGAYFEIRFLLVFALQILYLLTPVAGVVELR